jgi:hypothetical protein
MSRVLGFRDLQLITELANLTELEMLHPSNDKLMESYLGKLGFDTDYAIQYVPNNYRDMRDKVGVGFRAIGELQINRAFINSYLCSTMERVAATSYHDRSLTVELANLMGGALDFKSFSEGGVEEDEGQFFQELLDPDWKMIANQIKVLTDLRDKIRGPSTNASGNPKTFEEYKEYYDAQQFYEEKYT